MGEFFKPWRRRFGMLTLVMACVLMVGWVRSFEFADVVEIYGSIPRKLISLKSINGRVQWCYKEWSTSWGPYCGYGVGAERSVVPEVFSGAARYVAIFPWRDDWLCLGGDEFISIEPNAGEEGLQCSIPHWSIIIPLTVISACLLLSKPKTSTQTKTTIPIQDEKGGAAS